MPGADSGEMRAGSGIKFTTGEYNNPCQASAITWVLAASEVSTGKGFVLSFSSGRDTLDEDAQKRVFDDVIDTLSYDSSKTTMDYKDAAMFSIKAGGDWSVTFSPISEMQELGNGVEHGGDGVYFMDETTLTKIHVANNDDSNFASRV